MKRTGMLACFLVIGPLLGMLLGAGCGKKEEPTPSGSGVYYTGPMAAKGTPGSPAVVQQGRPAAGKRDR